MSATNASTTEAATVISPAMSLYRDTLQAIFQFLYFTEFVRTVQVSREWATAGRTMKMRKDYLEYHRSLCLLVQSPLRHHISNLSVSRPLDDNGLRDRMDHLNVLNLACMISYHQLAACPASPPLFPMPTQLTELTLLFGGGPSDAVAWTYDKNRARRHVSECLKLIGTQCTRLIKLVVDIENANSEIACPLDGLLSITTLTDITLALKFNLNQQVDLIKLMPHVRKWSRLPAHFSLDNQSVQRLVDGGGPTSSQLESIGRIAWVDEATALQLRRLSSLTRLELFQLTLPDPTILLPHLSHLSILHLNTTKTVNPHHLSTALSACVSLTSLTLDDRGLTSDHISRFLPHLISLVELKFNYCIGLASLQFLTDSSKSLTNLHTFALVGSTRIPFTDYDTHLRSISSSLQFLQIIVSISVFDPRTIEGWTPGSTHFSRHEWPQLKTFHFTPTNK